jgi:hypothetical protein
MCKLPERLVSRDTNTFIWKRTLDTERKNKTRMAAVEMKFMRQTARYTWMDHKINDIEKELKK